MIISVGMSDDALKRLFWGLLLFGLLLAVIGVLTESLLQILIPPAALCMGLGMILMAHHGRRTGEMQSGKITRDEHPILFWFYYLICLALGLTVLTVALWLLFVL